MQIMAETDDEKHDILLSVSPYPYYACAAVHVPS